MYPKIFFGGKIEYKKVIENFYPIQEKVAAFFSGGADATSTIVTHMKENPITITLWGADIETQNEKGWSVVKKFIEDNTPEIKNHFVKSTFREVVNDENLNKFVRKYVNENWWHGFQHGLGLIGHAAPISYVYKIGKVYIPSSFTEKDKGVTCASDPSIDNFVKFASCKIIHDGYEYTRQEKIKNICRYNKNVEKKLKLRVCYMCESGENCNRCEKCVRTIMAIKAENSNPVDYGFTADYRYIKDFLTKHCYFDNIIYPLWEDIYKEFAENKEILKNDKEINWIYEDFSLQKINKEYRRIDRRIIRLIKRKLKI